MLFAVINQQYTWPLDASNANKEKCLAQLDISFTNTQITDDGAYFLGIGGSYGMISDFPSDKFSHKISFLARFFPRALDKGPLFHGVDGNFASHIWFNDGKLYTQMKYKQGACPNLSTFSDHQLSLNEWHTVAMSFNGITGQHRSWVDGQLTTKKVAGCAYPLRLANDFYTGAW